jgi:hypothetical protein
MLISACTLRFFEMTGFILIQNVWLGLQLTKKGSFEPLAQTRGIHAAALRKIRAKFP